MNQGSKSRKISYRAIKLDFVHGQNIFRARRKLCKKLKWCGNCATFSDLFRHFRPWKLPFWVKRQVEFCFLENRARVVKSCTFFFSWFLTLVWIILITLFKRFLVRNMSMLQSGFIMLKIKFVEKMLKDWLQKKQFSRPWRKWMTVTKKSKKW